MKQDTKGVLEREGRQKEDHITLDLSFQRIPKRRDALYEQKQFIAAWQKQLHSAPVMMKNASNDTVEGILPDTHEAIICTRKINNVRYLNKYFESINRSLMDGGLYIGCVETNYQLRKRLEKKYPRIILYPFILMLFLGKRVLPKWSVFKRLYFYITRGKKRMISLTELLGRLVSCGFQIQEYRSINGLTWFAVTKSQKPAYDMEPTYGLLVGLKRVGKNGRLMKMYKFRTMHPYAEYIQGYVYDRSGLDKGDKIIDDFRVTAWGAIMRKYWIDELPMIINLLKGDIKLVGVRPLSEHKLSLYSQKLKDIRKMNKPGLIPPYYVDMPDTFEGLQESEYQYLVKYSKHPFKTDVVYFFKAVYNILIKRARSG
ncbi:sugar transferase [Balneolaceae bacterium ANBcel3]|nr:sugar transferase [Balneolaceae bacterium ANBcel3]